MKKLVVVLIVSLFVVFGYVIVSEETEENEIKPETTSTSITTLKAEITENKMYCVWLTYSEIGSLVKGKTENEYRESLETVFSNLKENKINTVFYQCRAFCDSFYASDIFPASKYVTANNRTPIYDPLEIFLEKAQAQGISVHCWINPYRISYDSDFDLLPEDSPAIGLYKASKNNLIICSEGIFLNPAADESRALVLNGIREILNKYKVDGIHFDDYFYPDAQEINDRKLYKEYTSKGGDLTLNGWRRENVSVLVSSVYSLVKAENPSLVFSISPSADIEKCKNTFYADVEQWCSEEGFVDLIIPQIYYGFQNEAMPFDDALEEWVGLAEKGSVKLICGLAPYKCGRADRYAGTGENEWLENVNILSRQYEQTLKAECCQGFSLFSYSYCFGENVNDISKKEIKNLLCMIE